MSSYFGKTDLGTISHSGRLKAHFKVPRSFVIATYLGLAAHRTKVLGIIPSVQVPR